MFRAGLVMKAPLWNLIIHDWSKFTPAEWFAYTEHFYGKDRGTPFRPHSSDFRIAWLHHIHLNPHHWNHWVEIGNRGKVIAYEMPEKYAREMIADWLGAERGISGTWDYRKWWDVNKDKVVLHPKTRDLVLQLLGEADQWLKLKLAV